MIVEMEKGIDVTKYCLTHLVERILAILQWKG
jgi:hypothetical protein